MTEHPEDLLAEFVDDALGPEERARVESHLRACASCRDEVEEASRARLALGSLPDVEPPPGLELGVRRAERRSRRGAWTERAVRWGGAAAVAAGLVGFLVWVGLTQGTGGGDAGRIAAPEAAPSPAAVPAQEDEAAQAGAPAGSADRTGLEFTSTNADYDPGSLQVRTRALAQEARDALGRGFPPTARDFYAGVDLEAVPRRAADALSCVTDAVAPDRSIVPFAIEEASFGGSPVYLAAFLQGPGADAPYDRLTLMVVERDACTLRHFARQLL